MSFALMNLSFKDGTSAIENQKPIPMEDNRKSRGITFLQRRVQAKRGDSQYPVHRGILHRDAKLGRCLV